MNNELSPSTLDRMFNDEVRIGQIIHIRAALSDCESPSEQMEEFLEDHAHDLVDELDAGWPDYKAIVTSMVATWETERKEDRRYADQQYISELASFFYRHCPRQLLVQVEYTNSECIRADSSGELLGTWRSGWGYYRQHWFLVDSITEAAELGLAKQHRRKVESWTQALKGKAA